MKHDKKGILLIIDSILNDYKIVKENIKKRRRKGWTDVGTKRLKTLMIDS